ncbi:serine/threonine-protein kinase [Nannocystis sp. ILAH1]|uniref:serine/threonine protein kinase n=1 Tax=unclassified Nannocystis TaxID=2627009 RepID=UPI00226F9759|nr:MULTISPECIES: serine/threonine-protein kinase [unclassified Nannocystis]MCY0991624.1 serine/threonine-protein kinase [Nannocystis sp. ILAH1]MCY1066674.1 serine/threonine-protein kinase [Nannocystis sp. RBIL2]
MVRTSAAGIATSISDSGDAGRGSGMGADLVGTLLLGRYQVLERIGDGGMGAVYLAEHTTILKKFAIKVLSAQLSLREDHVDRFMREARSASMINHPNVVEITDFGKTPDGQPFFVMEYLQGKDLAQVLGEGAMAWKRARPILLQVCSALQAAHEQGIVHRDIKPGNILLVKRGSTVDHVKVLDFGIAKVLNHEPDAKGLTQSGVVVGTPEYMSPEQGWGQSVDHRGDIYALGVLLYELLTSKIPFSGATMMEVLNRHMFEVPDIRHPNIPEEVGAIILKAMQKDRSLRFQSMNEMAAAVEAVGTGASPVTVVDEEIKTPWGPVTARFNAVPAAQQRSWVWLSVLSAVVAVGAVVYAMVPVDGGQLPPAPVAAPVIVPPTPAPTPVVEQKVVAPEAERVRFKITTPGVQAQILAAEDQGQLGVTNDPDGVEVVKSEEKMNLILRAPGYEDQVIDVVPNQDKTFERQMVVKAAAPTPTPTPAPAHTQAKPKPDKKPNKPQAETKVEAAAPDEGDEEIKNPFKK